jgi:NAD(P)H-dependent FMN reductase
MQTSYLLISATNRIGSKSLQIANFYQQLLQQKNIDCKILALENIPINVFDINSKSEILKAIEIDLLMPATKFIFIVPEYNGSFPGALKMMMDCCDTKNVFWNKKAALVGLSDGRNGNLRGLDHLTGVLNYLKINVLHYKVNIPQVSKVVDANNNVIDAQTQNTLQKQMDEFINF